MIASSAKRTILFLTISLGSTNILYGTNFRENFQLVRPNAVGGAFTAVANDENAVWTNPAGIARIRKARSRKTIHLVTVPNLILGANTDGQKLIQGIAKDGTQKNIERLTEQSQDNSKPLWSALSAFPLLMFEMNQSPAVVGLYTHTTMTAIPDSDEESLLRTRATSDVGGILSFSFSNQSNRLNFGLNLRYVARYSYEDNLPIVVLEDKKALESRVKDNANQMRSLGVDAGILFTFSDFWFPTIGIAVFNLPIGCQDSYLNPYSREREKVCGTTFQGEIVNPDDLSNLDPTDIRVGLSITPRLSRKIALRISVDMHQIAIPSSDGNYGLANVPIGKQLHGGVELVTGNPLLPSPLSVGVGLSQGYYSFGWGFTIGSLAINFSTFGRDISYTSKPVEDRRVAGSLSFRI